MRINQYLARAGWASRRKAEELIRQGRVLVNGQPATLATRVEEGDQVEVDGKRVELPKTVVIAFHKPKGYTTTRKDSHAERTVYDLLPGIPGLHPVGRLDKDSEGLLLLTNDGALTHHLTHPRYGVKKTYRVWTREGTLPKAVCQRLVQGVELEDGLAKALSAKPAPGGGVLVLSEGRKREVRRMLQRLGYTVSRLLRLRVGPIALGDLPPGRWRVLSLKELEALYNGTDVRSRQRTHPNPSGKDQGPGGGARKGHR
ncbi:MAG: pseudouridine synthase [Thermaceae bacterium]